MSVPALHARSKSIGFGLRSRVFRRRLHAWRAFFGREDLPAPIQRRRQQRAARAHRDRCRNRRWLGIPASSARLGRMAAGPASRNVSRDRPPGSTDRPAGRCRACRCTGGHRCSPARAAGPDASERDCRCPGRRNGGGAGDDGLDCPRGRAALPPRRYRLPIRACRPLSEAGGGRRPAPGRFRAACWRGYRPTDYRNAEIAIQTAVAKTADDAVFVWPRQRKPELALFRVRFVPGAAPECRRYVVTVTKDGWSTTAPPMEKCGSAAPQKRMTLLLRSALTSRTRRLLLYRDPSAGGLADLPPLALRDVRSRVPGAHALVQRVLPAGAFVGGGTAGMQAARSCRWFRRGCVGRVPLRAASSTIGAAPGGASTMGEPANAA